MSEASQIVSCPHCQTRMRAPASGQAFRCPKCGKQIQLQQTQNSKSTSRPPAKQSGATVPTSVDSVFEFGQAGDFPALTTPPVASFPQLSGKMPGGPNLPARPSANNPNSAANKPTEKKLWLLVAAAIGSFVLLSASVGVAIVVIFGGESATVQPPVAAIAAQANAPAAADPNAIPEMPEKKERPPGAAPYVGLDQIIYKPGDTLGPKEEGSGKRVIGVGKSMQPNEVRTVMWRITNMAGGGDKKAQAEQQLRTINGYVYDSLVIDSQKQVVRLKYKGTVLTARDYRIILEFETELTLDPEPYFP